MTRLSHFRSSAIPPHRPAFRPVRRRIRRPAVAALAAIAGLAGIDPARAYYNDYESPPFLYFSAPLHDPMSLLLGDADHGMGERAGKELVAHLLEKLDIPVTSQVLVFSKTSLQTAVVSPENPRAIYFNDDVYLGWMQGGRIEIASDDPVLGPIFYFEGRRDLEQANPGPVTFERPNRCLGCHAGSATDFIPGVFAQSNYTNREGRGRGTPAPWENVHHSIPFEERWGGWFVTGAPPAMRHLGNRFVDGQSTEPALPDHAEPPLRQLDRFFPPDRHLRPGSNIAALMVFDHQVGFHDLLTRARYKVRYFQHEESPDAGEDAPLAGEALEVATVEAGKIVANLLFANAAPFPTEGIEPDGAFLEEFAGRGPFDAEGRSLRQFAFEDGRLFRHRCSYMIYSNAFRGLPTGLKRLVYDGLHAALVARPGDEQAFDHIEETEREAIASILRATVDDLEISDAWRSE